MIAMLEGTEERDLEGQGEVTLMAPPVTSSGWEFWLATILRASPRRLRRGFVKGHRHRAIPRGRNNAITNLGTRQAIRVPQRAGDDPTTRVHAVSHRVVAPGTFHDLDGVARGGLSSADVTQEASQAQLLFLEFQRKGVNRGT